MRLGIRVLSGVVTVVVCAALLQAVPATAVSEKLPVQNEWSPGADFVPPEPPRPDVLEEQEEPEPLPLGAPAADVPADSAEGAKLTEFESRLDEVAERARNAASPPKSHVETPDPPTEIDHPVVPTEQTNETASPEPSRSSTPAPTDPLPTTSPTPEVSPTSTSTPPTAMGPVFNLASTVIRAASSSSGCRQDGTSPDGRWGIWLQQATTIRQVTNTQEGVYDLLLVNRGSSDIPSGSKLRYRLFDASGHEWTPTQVAATLSASIAAGASATIRANVGTLTPGQRWTLAIDFEVTGLGTLTSQSACAPNLTLDVVNQYPTDLTLLEPAVGATVQGKRPYLTATAKDPDKWPNARLTYSFKICADRALSLNCLSSGIINDSSWRVPEPGLDWGSRYFWAAQASDGEASIDSVSFGQTNDFYVVAPQPDEWRRIGQGLGLANVDGLILPYGVFTSSATDAVVSGAGKGISVDRVFSTGADRVEGAFGRGWLSLLDAGVVVTTNQGTFATVTFPDGRQETYGRNANGTWAAGGALGSTNQFSMNASGAMTVREAAGITYSFDRFGGLQKIDYGDSSWQLSSADGEVKKVTQSPSGRALTFEWDSNSSNTCSQSPRSTRKHVVSIKVEGQSDSEWKYAYDCSRLTGVTNPAGGKIVYSTSSDTFAGTTPGGAPLPGLKTLGAWTWPQSYYRERTVELTVPGSVVRKVAISEGSGEKYVNSRNFYGGPRASYCEYRSLKNGTENCDTTAVSLYFDGTKRMVVRKVGSVSDAITPNNSRAWIYNQNNGQLDGMRDENERTVAYAYDASGNLTTSYMFRDPNTQITSSSYFRDPTSTDPVPRISGQGISGRSTEMSKSDMFTYDSAGRLVKRVGAPTPGAPGGEVRNYTYTAATSPAYSANGSPVANANAPAGLLANESTVAGSTVYRYASNGDLVQFTPLGSGTTSRTYDGYGRVETESTKVSGSSSAMMRFKYDKLGRVVWESSSCVTNPISGISSRLETVRQFNVDSLVTRTTDRSVDCQSGDDTDSPRTTITEYDAVNRVRKKITPGGRVTTYAYSDANPAQVASTVDARGRKVEYTYSPTNGKVATEYGDVTIANTKVWRLVHSYQYDPAGRVVAEVDGLNRTTTYAYTGDNLLLSKTRKQVENSKDTTKHDVEMWRGTYDARGNVISETIGNLQTKTYIYDAENRLQSTTVDPKGVNKTTTLVRDAAGRLVGSILSDSPQLSQATRIEKTSYTVDSVGRPLVTTVENGDVDIVQKSTRDLNGLVTASVDPAAFGTANESDATSTVEYDVLGRTSTSTGPRVETSAPSDAARFSGLVTTQARAANTFGYNAFGDLTQVRDSFGRVTSMSYGVDGQLVKRMLPSYTPPGASEPVGGESTFVYSSAGDLVSQTDERGSTIRYSYDIMGNRTRSEADVPGGGSRVTVSAFDEVGQLRATTDPRGSTTVWFRDKLGRVIWRDQTGLEDSCCIDGDIHVVGATDYDDAGNVTDQWDNGIQTRNGAHTRFEYNGAGELTATWAPLQTQPTRFTLDFAGRVVKQVAPDGVSIETEYDVAGRATSSTRVATDGTRLVETYTVDAAGRRTGLTRANGQTQSWVYDYAGHVLSFTEALTASTSRTVKQGYDIGGNRVRVVDTRGYATWNTYNSRGQIEGVIEPATSSTAAVPDRSWMFAYDAGGLRTKETAPGGVTRVNNYDSLGQLVSYVASDPATPNSSVNRTIEYSNAGSITRISTPGVSQNYTWGSWGQLLTARGPVSNADYGYDDALRLSTARETVPGVAPPTEYTDSTNFTSYDYDSAGRTTGIWASAWKRTVVTQRRFDEKTGKPVEDSYRSNNISKSGEPTSTGSRKFFYDKFGRVQDDVVYNKSGVEQSRTTLAYDAVDNITQKVTSGELGDSGGSYAYDLASRLVTWQPLLGTTPSAIASQVAYSWDAENNRLSEKSPSSTKAWQYDGRDLPTTMTITTGGSTTSTPITTNARGDVTSIGTRTLAYNALDELTSDSGATYDYDALGRMITRGDQNILYSGLDNQPLATVGGTGLRDVTSRGIDGAAGATFDLSTKALGQLLTNSHTDTTGRLGWEGEFAVTSRRDPFGVPLSPAARLEGSTHSGYQGDWTDPSSGTVRMGVRWYEPALGRFLTRDTVTLPVLHGGATNRYAYADANPLNLVDSTGHAAAPPAPPMIDINEFWKIVGPNNKWGAQVLNDALSSAARSAASSQAPVLAARTATGIATETALARAGLSVLRLGWGAWILVGIVTAAVGLIVDLVNRPKPTLPKEYDNTSYDTIKISRGVTVPDSAPVRTVSEAGGKRIVTDTIWATRYVEWWHYSVETRKYSLPGAGYYGDNVDIATTFLGRTVEKIGRVIFGQSSFVQDMGTSWAIAAPTLTPVDPRREGISLTGRNVVAGSTLVRQGPNASQSTGTANCGLGGTITSCQQPTGGNVCNGVLSPAAVCAIAEPTPGRAGGTGSNALQTSLKTPETQAGSDGSGGGWTPPPWVSEHDCEDLPDSETIDALREEFKSVKREYWKNEIAKNPTDWKPWNKALVNNGRAPRGIDGLPMEVHHILPLYMGGTNDFDNLVHLTQTEHRLGENYKKNHPC